MKPNYRNKNRGDQQLRVWEDAAEAEFTALNDLAFKLENGLLRLVESLEQKQITGDWTDSLIIKESNVACG